MKDAQIKESNENNTKRKNEANTFVGVIAVIILITGIWSCSGNKDSTTVDNVTSITKSTETSPSSIPEFKMNEAARVGAFEFAAISYNISSEFSGTKTENQFVVVKVKMTNNDSKPRDFSKSLFQLKDGTGKTYAPFDGAVSDNSLLVYETVNPGLSKTRTIIFETPKEMKGFQLDCNSGVLLAGGEHILINLQ
ncbi:DUF4352 domain-containing protein [Paenibacillus whitsoniae]|uniref:DUF4352 domain-containing protein n=1 Tax=Paenibacillus whitsoniae TaxID=2496558 RepID=A0A3S0CRD2_9BACL|nr:DUF4352 domain-containing protein [Paenibacillus whitsoniae]RTE05476.1 DUF4352 domain-containing protein [Paenibacillus whitsoniae]